MILGNIEHKSRYATLHPLFPKAFDFLSGQGFSGLADGKHVIEGDSLFAMISRNGDSVTASKLEAHKRYIDIHYAAEGSDTMGWKPLAGCELPVGSFDEEKDFILYDDADFMTMPLSGGDFIIVYPEDAHAPLLHTKGLLKIVLKIEL